MSEKVNGALLFDELYNKFYKRVFSYFLKEFDNSVAEDLTQQTFLKLWTYILSHPKDKIDKPKSLIFTIAKNVKNDFLRLILSKPYFSLDESGDVSYNNDFVKRIELNSALALLNDDERKIIKMKDSGLSSREMAKCLGITPSGARSRLKEAKDKLKRILEDM